jgi:hypothetical protein
VSCIAWYRKAVRIEKGKRGMKMEEEQSSVRHREVLVM